MGSFPSARLPRLSPSHAGENHEHADTCVVGAAPERNRAKDGRKRIVRKYHNMGEAVALDRTGNAAIREEPGTGMYGVLPLFHWQ